MITPECNRTCRHNFGSHPEHVLCAVKFGKVNLEQLETYRHAEWKCDQRRVEQTLFWAERDLDVPDVVQRLQLILTSMIWKILELSLGKKYLKLQPSAPQLDPVLCATGTYLLKLSSRCVCLISRLERIKEAEERDEADPDDDSNVRTHAPFICENVRPSRSGVEAYLFIFTLN